MKKIELIICALLFVGSTTAQSSKDKEIIKDSNDAKAAFIKQDPQMAGTFSKAFGYVIFPNVGKGGLGIGGASGHGAAYQNGQLVGMAKMSQVTIGLQAGGQAYREVIFFEKAEPFQRFKENKIEFSAQVSAVAASSGASANAKYKDGVLVFTMQKGGLMYEASLGGQKFKFTPPGK
jgi:lipid-binding SYLF domain-containing protein